MQGIHLRKYGVETTIDFELYEVDGVDLRVDWVPEAADCEIMKDEGASTQCANTATDEGSTYSIVLTATEMEAARHVLKIVDSATGKVFLDKVIGIETYGHPSAMHAFDLDTARQTVDLTHVMGTILTEGAGGRLAAAFIKLFDVATPTLVASDVMRGTDSVVLSGPTKAEMDTAHGLLATEAKQDIIDTIVDAIKAVTDLLPDAGALDDLATILTQIGTAGAGLTDLGGMSSGMKAEVNAEALDVLVTDTHAEPASLPAATSSLKDKIAWLFTLSRNKGTQTSTTKTLRNDGDAADIATSAISSDGTTFTRNKWA